MRTSNKILLVWLSVMWTIFSFWLFVVTQFPLNIGVIGLESIAVVILIWTMHIFRDAQNFYRVPSE